MENVSTTITCSADREHPRTFPVPSGTPGELLVSHRLPTSAQLSWTPVPEDKRNDIITSYTVRVERPGSTEKREIPVMDGNATSYEVSDLRPRTTYTFSVSAMTKAGSGPQIEVSSTTPQGGKLIFVEFPPSNFKYRETKGIVRIGRLYSDFH